MITAIALFVMSWTIIFILMNKEGSANTGEMIFVPLVAALALTFVLGVLVSLPIMDKIENDPDYYDISVRERPIVSLRTLDGISGEFSGFLGVSGTIKGETTYRYFVEKENGSIVPVKRNWCSFREGEIAVERVEMWIPKKSFFTKYILLGELNTREGHVEIVVPKGGIVRTMEARP